jgi:hypothetical protein
MTGQRFFFGLRTSDFGLRADENKVLLFSVHRQVVENIFTVK